MKFNVLLKSELDDLYEVSGLVVRLGKEHKENPDMDVWKALILRPGESYLFTTEDAKHEFAPFEKITFKQAFSKIPFEGDAKTKLRESVKIETKKRKDWDSKYCPFRNHKYVCLFTNLTEAVWSFFGEYIGRIEVRPGIPKRIPLSVLNIHLTKWAEIEIKYHRSADNLTGKILPRTAKWFGVKLRSEKELKELEKDMEAALKKYRLTPEIISPDMGVDDNLLKEKKSLLQAK